MSIFRPTTKKPERTLKKNLGLFEATMSGIGFILGAGIYVLIGAVANFSGSAIWLSFIFAGLAALTSGLSYAEVSSMYPVIESEYVYAKEGLGRFYGFYTYIAVILALTIGIAGVSLGFAGYFKELFGFENIKIIALMVILFFALVNWYSIKSSAKIVYIFTIASIIGLLAIVVMAFFTTSTTSYMIMPKGLLGVVKGASLIFFSYLGFEGIVKMADETKNARKNIPLAIIISIIISTIIYVAVALAAISVLSWEVLGASQAPLADVAAAILGNKSFIFLAIIALLSTANTILMGLLSASRGFYGIGQIFYKLKWFSKVGKRNTPTRAIIITTLITLPFLFFKNISTIIGFTNFLIFSNFILINFSAIKLRYKQPNIIRKFKMPLNINRFPITPLIGIIICIILILNLDLLHIIGGIIISFIIYILYNIVNQKGL